MACEKTITLTGAEHCVKLECQNCDIRNDGTGTVYVSRFPGIVPDADGVLSVPAGQAAKYCGLLGAVYLYGTGKVLLCGNDYSNPLFKLAATSSGEGGGTGADGKSAYEVAAANGFEGSVAEWLDSLQGEPGPQGESAVSAITPRGDYNAAAAPAYTVGDYITHTDGNTYVCKVDNPANVAPTDGTMADPFWQLIALRGAQGPAGAAGKDATINGSNALTIATGVGLKGAQTDGVYTMSVDGSVLSNPNLLDNPDFSINQRGQSVYDGTVAGGYKYTVDRWCFWKYNCDTYGTVTVNTDGSLSVDGADGANDCILTQIMENGSQLIGKTVTLSLEITEITGRIVVQLHKSSSAIYINKPGIYQLTFVWPELDSYRICIDNTNSSHYTIKWMKLEVGPVATAFVPPNPATELAKCKWYYRRIEQARIRAWGYTANSILFFISYPEMRIRPTATIKGSPTISNMEIASYNDFTCSVDWALPTGCRITAVKTAHGLTDGLLHINSDSNVYIELSADL